MYCSTVRTASAAPPIAKAALIFWRPAPGMSTIVSRAIDMRLFAPPPMRSSRIESERPLPVVCAPGSASEPLRTSEPSTRMFVGDQAG